MKQLLTFFALLAWLGCTSQGIISRSPASTTVADSRLIVKLNLVIPLYRDTTEANTMKGLDSSGAIIKTYMPESVWIRRALPSKAWVPVTTGGALTWQQTLQAPGGDELTDDNAVNGNHHAFAMNSFERIVLTTRELYPTHDDGLIHAAEVSIGNGAVYLSSGTGSSYSIDIEASVEKSGLGPVVNDKLFLGIPEYRWRELNARRANVDSLFLGGIYFDPAAVANQPITVTATGDATGTSTASATAPALPLTLATVNGNVGTFGGSTAIPIVTVDAKGRVTSVTTTGISGASGGTVTSVGLTSSDITVGGFSPITGTGAWTLTLPAVNANVGTFGSSTQIPIVTVDGKGRVTGVSTAAIAGGTVTSVAVSSSDITVGGTNPVTGTGTISLTLPTVNANVGTFGSTTSIPVVTVNGKGQVTGVSTVSVTGGVSTVFGRGGAVVAVAGDYNQNQITVTKQLHTSGTTVTVANATNWLVVKPALATLAITLPATPVDGQRVDISFKLAVTTLSVSANTGQTIKDAIGVDGVSAGESIAYQYDSGDLIWYRL